MNSEHVYGVYTARFPFLDSDKSKIRPVIVISEPQSKYSVVAVVPISSKLSLTKTDVDLSDLASSGLLRPSVAQVHRLSTLLQDDLIAKLGVLSKTDAAVLKQAMRAYLLL